jgi:small-conductance mechanosensitive channel
MALPHDMSDARPEPTPTDPLLSSDVSHALQQPWLHHTLATLVALIIAWGIWRLVLRGTTTLVRRTRFADLEPLVVKVVRWAYWLLALLFVLQQAGVDTQSLWTAITATAALVAVGFIAVWSVLSNLVSSLLILGARLFRPRDEIEVLDVGGAGIRGRVLSVDLMFTLVEEQRGDGRQAVLKVPNNLFFQKVLRVYRDTETNTGAEVSGASAPAAQPFGLQPASAS